MLHGGHTTTADHRNLSGDFTGHLDIWPFEETIPTHHGEDHAADYVQAFGAFALPVARHLGWIVGVLRLAREVALDESNAVPAANVNGRNGHETSHLQSAFSFRQRSASTDGC